MVGALAQGLKSFIQRCVPSFLAWDLVLLFANSGGQRLDIPAIQDHLAVRDDTLSDELAGLERSGVLTSTREGWVLEPSPELADDLSEFMDAVGDSKGRLRVLTYFLEAQQER